jgi:AhpD family alkylhydroperoxidase
MISIKQIDEAFIGFRDAVVSSPNLCPKNKELIALSSSAIVDCQPCVELHYKGAVAAGATAGEVAEAIALAQAVASGKIKIKTNDYITKVQGSPVAIGKIDDAFGCFRDAVVGSPNLQPKIKELIALADAAIIDCQPCVELHYKGAVSAGASAGEIAEAMALAMAVASGKIKLKTNQYLAGVEK